MKTVPLSRDRGNSETTWGVSRAISFPIPCAKSRTAENGVAGDKRDNDMDALLPGGLDKRADPLVFQVFAYTHGRHQSRHRT